MLMVAFYSFHIMIRGVFKYFYAVFFVFLLWETTNNFQFLWWFENVFPFFHYLLISQKTTSMFYDISGLVLKCYCVSVAKQYIRRINNVIVPSAFSNVYILYTHIPLSFMNISMYIGMLRN